MKEKLLKTTKKEIQELKEEIFNNPKNWTPSKIVKRIEKHTLEYNNKLIENKELLERLSIENKLTQHYDIESEKYRKALVKILNVINYMGDITDWKGKVINPKPTKKGGKK